jgi:hypothetical protein
MSTLSYARAGKPETGTRRRGKRPVVPRAAAEGKEGAVEVAAEGVAEAGRARAEGLEAQGSAQLAAAAVVEVDSQQRAMAAVASVVTVVTATATHPIGSQRTPETT